MSEKPIIVTIDRNNIDDFISYTDENGNAVEQKGLCKQVPNTYLRNSVQELLEYMVHPESDEHNDAYSDKEIDVARKIEAVSVAPSAYLLHRKGGEVDDSFRIYLSEKLDKYFSQIVEPKQIISDGEPQSYKSIDLLITVDNGGGHGIHDRLH